MRRKVLLVAGLVGSGYAFAYAGAHRRRRTSYTAARAWLNVPDDEEVTQFLKRVGSLPAQKPVKSPATERSVRAFRRKFDAIKPKLKTGDVVLFRSHPKLADPFHYKVLEVTQEYLGVKSEVGVITHSALVLKVPDDYSEDSPIFLLDSVTPDNLGEASDRLVAAESGDPLSRPALNLVQMSSRLESYHGDVFLLSLSKPLSPHNERRLWRFLYAEYRRNPEFDVYHLLGAGLRESGAVLIPEASEDWTSFFCSEFVIAALKVAHVIEPSVNSTLFQPGAIETLGVFDRPIYMLHEFESCEPIGAANLHGPYD